MLTADQKAQARELGLSQEEARFSLATHIPLTRYAEVKAELQAGRDADDAMMQRFSDAAGEGLETAYRGGRGVALPPLEEDA